MTEPESTLHFDERFSAIEARLTKIEMAIQGDNRAGLALAGAKPPSIREFLNTKKPSDDVQKTLAMAYFLEKSRGLTSINVDDISDAFRSAKEPLPGNLNDKVYKAIKRGLLMEAKEKKNSMKAWVLTATGETFVEANFISKD